jgi:hypothetical protein
VGNVQDVARPRSQASAPHVSGRVNEAPNRYCGSHEAAQAFRIGNIPMVQPHGGDVSRRGQPDRGSKRVMNIAWEAGWRTMAIGILIRRPVWA